MSWASKHQAKREEFWPEVEQFFGHLPPRLFRQGVLLKNNLATFYSDTGQFKDILKRDHDHPLLCLHLWLLDDLHVSATTDTTSLERHLFLGMAFTFAAVYTQESILDESTSFDNSFLLLAQTLTRQANFSLAQLLPESSSFWSYHRRFWDEYAEAILATADGRPQTAKTTAKKLAFSKIPVAAVALSIGQAAVLPQLCLMMDRLNFVLQTLHDLSTIKRDLAQRNLTYPLARTMREVNIDPYQPVPPERILGALVLTGTVEKICAEGLSSLAECRALATTLNLPTFITYLEIVENLVGQVRELFDLRIKPTPATGQPRPLFAPYVDPRPKVIEMAEGYLLADPTFSESWEVQRRSTFGVPKMTAKAFPSGLIVEILCRHGHEMADAVAEIFRTLETTGFRYYDFAGMPPDADDLGLLLRLFPYSRQQTTHQAILQTPLRWLRQNIRESGEIPVWFTQQDDFDETAQPSVALWGQNCVTVAANVLLGLIDYDLTALHELIEPSTQSILAHWITQGLSATRHYVPLYSLWIGFELIAKLAVSPLQLLLQSQLDIAALSLTGRLESEAKRATITPQDAALLTLACLSAGCPPSAKKLFNPRWITILCQTQRYDGSWASEPIYGTPSRGELATWYASRSVTTAFSYHALKTFQIQNDEL